MDQNPFARSKWTEHRLPLRLLAGLALATALVPLLPIGTGAPARAQSRSAPELWQQAQTETQADSAAIILRRLIGEFPRHPLAGEAQLALADYYFARGDYPLSRVFYHRAAEGKPVSGRATLGEARSYYALGDYSTARNVARPVLQSREHALSWSAAFLIALTWQAEGQAAEADAVFRRLLAQNPGPAQPAALLAAARVAVELGDATNAAELLLRLRSHYPESSEAVEARGLDPAAGIPAGSKP
jgi:tetratricopeptide (TPR) repeat protein